MAVKITSPPNSSAYYVPTTVDYFTHTISPSISSHNNLIITTILQIRTSKHREIKWHEVVHTTGKMAELAHESIWWHNPSSNHHVILHFFNIMATGESQNIGMDYHNSNLNTKNSPTYIPHNIKYQEILSLFFLGIRRQLRTIFKVKYY